MLSRGRYPLGNGLPPSLFLAIPPVATGDLFGGKLEPAANVSRG